MIARLTRPWTPGGPGIAPEGISVMGSGCPVKGCRDHVDAARAGHLHCLGLLCEEGVFLPLNSPYWVSAGEARKCQVFEAAIAGCGSGHANVLAWLFSSGWPSDFDAIFPVHTQDLWEQHEDFATAFPALETDTEPFCLEYKLYCCAVQQPTPSCLEALLNAGYRSEWICRIAAREGKADFLLLAAQQGCPCDWWVWEFAASTGKHAVLELLASDNPTCRILNKDCKMKSVCPWLKLPVVAASKGQWECLQILISAGHTDVVAAAEGAARAGQLQILQNLVDLDPGLLQHKNIFNFAARSGSLACLEFLEQAGCMWEGDEAVAAASSKSLEALRYCLRRSREQLQGRDWNDAMSGAIFSRSPDCMQALYDYGYLCPAAESDDHPARLAIMYNSWACLRLAVKLSGPPKLSQVARSAGMEGEVILQFVHGLGATLDSEVTECAASAGQAGALRYALQHGAPLSLRTFGAAVEGESVECLKCAFEHGLAVGFPADYHQPTSDPFLPWMFPYRRLAAPSLRMLRYVCEVMRPPWVQRILTRAVGFLARSQLKFKEGRDAWKMHPMQLYLAKRMEGRLPWPLDELVRVRRKRARALAGVFYRAKKLVRAGAPSPSLALWEAMERVPLELRERIAFVAHLICPVTQLGPL
eukprot:jgi/Botrbrau1/20533/Bobra.145_2s0082.1